MNVSSVPAPRTPADSPSGAGNRPRRLSFQRHLVQKNDRRLRRAPASCTCPVLCNPVKISTAERSGDAAVPFSECKSTASFLNGKGTAGVFSENISERAVFAGGKGAGGRRGRQKRRGRAGGGRRARAPRGFKGRRGQGAAGRGGTCVHLIYRRGAENGKARACGVPLLLYIYAPPATYI